MGKNTGNSSRHRFALGLGITLGLVGLAILTALPSYTAELSRRERDEAAKRAFLGLNFFHNGLGMHISPGLIKVLDLAKKYTKATGSPFPLLKNRYGILQLPGGDPVGVYNIEYSEIEVGVLGCVACHSGRAAGQFVIGIGNKNVDVGQIGADAFLGESVWKSVKSDRSKSDDYKRVEEAALAFASELNDPKRTNLTQGLVPTSIVKKWFFRMANEPYPEDMPRGAVKVPHLFGYGEKRRVGQFADARGNGLLPGWGIGVELAAGQTPENVREYQDRLEPAEQALGEFLPPPYPFAIDRVRADRGKVVFETNCAGCHGTYENDGEGAPVYKEPKVVPWEVVRTDHDRIDQFDPHLIELIEKSPLSDIIQHTDHENSYVAPRLHAIWARFPYLHNGSVPTILDLLSPAADRPKYFSLDDAGERARFDEGRLGLNIQGKYGVRRKPSARTRDVYDTERVGQSNAGHEFHTDLDNGSKLDLVEYLKTL